MIARVPGVVFFFALLALHAREPALALWSAAFIAPYLALVDFGMPSRL